MSNPGDRVLERRRRRRASRTCSAAWSRARRRTGDDADSRRAGRLRQDGHDRRRAPTPGSSARTRPARTPAPSGSATGAPRIGVSAPASAVTRRHRCSSSFMTEALADLPDVPLPDPGPVCARPIQNVIDTGGRTDNAPVVPVHARPTPQLPTVQQQPTAPPDRRRPQPLRRRPRPPPRPAADPDGTGTVSDEASSTCS